MSFPDHSRLELTNVADGSQVTVYLQGAHVTSWRTRDGEEHLYNSPGSVYQAGKAIRGGVPLIYPQFSDLGPLPTSHGFLRVSRGWRVESCVNAGGTCTAVLAYDMVCGATETGFEGARAALRYTIAFSATTLSLSMEVRNDAHAGAPLTFGFAFHSYFAVADVHRVRVAGLDGFEYLDNLQGRKRCAAEPVSVIDREVDRIYLHQDGNAVELSTQTAAGAAKTLTITGTNMTEAVLWNPWIEKAKGMSDMPDDAYTKFVCVEHGRITSKPTLAAGEAWTGAQVITAAL